MGLVAYRWTKRNYFDAFEFDLTFLKFRIALSRNSSSDLSPNRKHGDVNLYVPFNIHEEHNNLAYFHVLLASFPEAATENINAEIR